LGETTLSLGDPAVRRDPYAHYARWRDGARVQRCDFRGGSWLVHRFADVRHVLASPAEFSSAATTAPGVARTMAIADPPEHGRLRGAVAPAFGARAVSAIEPLLRSHARTLLEPLRYRAELEVVGGVAEPLAVHAVAELLGVAAADRGGFRDGAYALIGRAGGIDERLARVGALRACLVEMVARRCGPTAGGVAAGALSADEAVETLILLVVAGVETSARLIANVWLTLARHPDERRRLLADAAPRAAAIDEVLRYEPPLHIVPRVARRDVEIGGTEMLAGDGVLVVLAAASRDPAAFSDPDLFRIDRPERSHLGFGAGVHRCPGALLARAVAQIALDELMRAAPAFELATTDRELAWAPGFPLLRSPKALHIAAGHP
jgi:cytochrome P450